MAARRRHVMRSARKVLDGRARRSRFRCESRREMPMDTQATELIPEASALALQLSAQQRALLGEALSLLIETRARALELTIEVCRRHGSAVPDVHDYDLPAIIDLQRRISGKRH